MLLRLRSALALASCIGTAISLGQGEMPPIDPTAIEERIAALEAADASEGDDSGRNQTIATFQESLALAKQLQSGRRDHG